MKISRVGVVVFVALCSASIAGACDDFTIDLSQTFLDRTVQMAKNGTGDSSEEQRARKILLESQYCAGIYSKDTYCANVAIQQYGIVMSAKKRFENGLVSAADYANEIKEMNRVKEHCKGTRP